MTASIERPAEHEYAAFYASYLRAVPEEADIIELLTLQPGTLRALLADLSPEQADFRPGPDEWSIKEVIGHVNDVERVFAYRALRISRADQTPLPGFEQDDYVRESNFSARTLADLLDEFDLLRRANLLAFGGVSRDVSLRYGTASGAGVTVRALIYMMAGHAQHHLESLREDYLPKL